MTYGSTFSGVGGLDIAIEHVFGAEPLWHVEPDPYAAAVLRRHWPSVPNLHRIEWLNDRTPRVDILCGGFPCPDLSKAGQGAGIDGPSSGLWRRFVDAAALLRPAVVALENVDTLPSRGLVVVLEALASLGFDAEWATLRASDVGAPHGRDRTFILGVSPSLTDAHVEHVRQVRERTRRREQAEAEPRGSAQDAMAHGHGHGQPGQLRGRVLHRVRPSQRDDAARCCSSPRWPLDRTVGPQGPRWSGPVPLVRRGDYGPPRGVHARMRRARLRALGNAVVPAQAAAAYEELWGRLVA